MLDSFSNIYSLTLQDLKDIEFHLSHNMKGYDDEDSRKDIDKSYKFNNLLDYERLIMHQLLIKNGMLVKGQEEERDFYRTPALFERYCNLLVKRKYLLKFQFTDYEIIYLLNPDLLETARK